MLFTSSSFALFYVVVVVAYYAIGARPRVKQALLVLASLGFYATYGWKLLPVLLGIAVVSFFSARAIQDAKPPRKKRLLVLSIVANLTVLGFFKYTNFGIANLNALFGLAGLHARVETLSLILPLGISFYTFQSISFVVDVYRNTFKKRVDALQFLALLTFFPHLVSGPILRFQGAVGQLEKAERPSLETVQKAFLLFAVGLAKKTAADLLAVPADRFFDSAGPHSVLETWSGLLAFVAQVYADFSGYTDMAVGSGLLLGITLPPNFNLPYVAISPADFWRRWHMSLSTWLRDYLYLPLAKRYRDGVAFALLVTWVVCGLWHGASWNFVVWGLYHGGLLIVTNFVMTKQLLPAFAVPWFDKNPSLLPRLLRIASVFYLVCIGNTIFRTKTLGEAWRMMVALHVSPVASHASSSMLMTLGWIGLALVGCHSVDYLVLQHERTMTRPWVLVPVALASLAFAITMTRGLTFIYFAF